LIPLDQRLAGLKPISDVTAGLIFLRYGREAEYEADQLGVGYAYDAGYDPRWLGAFLRSLAAQEQGRGAPPEFLSTHPSTPKRIARAGDLAAEVMAANGRDLEVGSGRYKKRLEGLLYGPGPMSWVWSGTRLANQAHRIALEPPTGWDLQVQRLAFAIAHHRVREKVSAASVGAFADAVQQQIKLESVARSSFDLGPLEGLKASYVGRSQGTDAVLLIYYGLDGQTGYTLAAITPVLFRDRLEPVYDALARSVVKLSSAKAEALPIQRVHLERVRAGEGLRQLVRRVYGTTDHVEAIALLNGLPPETSLTEGSLIKVILPTPIIRRSE
ncbi:MAG: M48 family metalloprotease, partial [Candidatus Tectimicrobiota bacterium]